MIIKRIHHGTAGTLWRRLGCLLLVCLTATALLTAHPSYAATGPEPVVESSYKFVARNEPLVLADRKVDLWAQVYRPKNLGKKPHPLLVLLHGNHGTCGKYDPKAKVRVDDNIDYTYTGKCPDGYVVTPNHLGYGYLAEEMASWGYIVVSINANRGITAGMGFAGDEGLNLARGRLILRHLALLSDWNRGAGALKPPASLGFDPRGSMDFSEVGLFGHSRGGEGVRAAIQQWRDKKSPFPALIGSLQIRAAFEIGPVDGQTARVLDADGVASMILLPGCDGDVSDLEGVRVFDRVFTRTDDRVPMPHGSFLVAGANHNAYNSEWLVDEGRFGDEACGADKALFPGTGRSTTQQATALLPFSRFMRAHVGRARKPDLAAIFDPNTALPKSLASIARMARGYLPRPIGKQVAVLEAFRNEGPTSAAGVPHVGEKLTVVNTAGPEEHDKSLRVATVSWKGDVSPDRYFQLGLAKTGGRDLSGYRTLAIRASVRCPAMDKPVARRLGFKLRLVGPDGILSRPLDSNDRVLLECPADKLALHRTVLATAEFALQDFRFGLKTVAALRFVFDEQPEGTVLIGPITLSTVRMAKAASGTSVPDAPRFIRTRVADRPSATADSDRNTIRAIRTLNGSSAASGDASTVELELTSNRRFPITDSLPRIMIGGREFRWASPIGDGRTMIVRIPAAEFATLAAGSRVTVEIGMEPVWDFDALPTR